MGRLNKKLAKKITKPTSVGLSNSATKALISIKDSIKIPTDVSVSAPAPTESFARLVEGKSVASRKSPGSERKDTKLLKENRINKKVLKSVKKDGKVVKLKKKDRMKLRTGLLVKKLTNIENSKKEVKDKKRRENVAIVKDTKPLLDDLEEISKEINENNAKNLQKNKTKLNKVHKQTLKMKKQKEQFMKDIEFLKAASKHPEYVTNPIEVVTTHIKNTVS